jgi:hypothetical protein
METSFIASNNPFQSCVLPNNADDLFADCAPGPLWHTNIYSYFFFVTNLHLDALLIS